MTERGTFLGRLSPTDRRRVGAHSSVLRMPAPAPVPSPAAGRSYAPAIISPAEIRGFGVAIHRRLVELTVHLGALTQNPWRAKFTDEPAMRRHPSVLQVVLGFATAAMIIAAVTRALYIAQKHQTVAAARDEWRIFAIDPPIDNEAGFVRDLPPPPRKEQDRF
jgi:hypothetical protein